MTKMNQLNYNETSNILMYSLFQEDILKDCEDPFTIPDECKWLTTDIGQKYEGKQKWIGHVIGKNQKYIHFRDQTQRIWIYVDNKINHIQINDLVVVHVNRKLNKTVKAEDVFVLQKVKG